MYARDLLSKSLLLPTFYLLFVLAILVFASDSATLHTRGIASQDANYFKSAIIKCRDGSKEFPREHLNDGFCDCPDGTDEPGTSACPEGKFYCHNAGHVPLTLFSSRVNDGICDCCDGSDEYEGEGKCPNTCWEAGKAARDKLKSKIATFERGAAIREKQVEQAKKVIADDETELAKLKSDEKILKGLVKKLKERKEQIEKAEEQERKEKEKEEQMHKKTEELSQENKPEFSTGEAEDKVQNLEEKLGESKSMENRDTTIEDSLVHETPTDEAIEHSKEEGIKHTNNDQVSADDASSDEATETRKEGESMDSDDTDSLSREELGRLVASRWTGEKSGEKSLEVDDNMEAPQHETNQDDDYNGYSSEADEDNKKYDDDDETHDNDDRYDDDEAHDNDDGYDNDGEDPLASYTSEGDSVDHSDITTPSHTSWLDKIQNTVKNIMQAVNLYVAPINKSEAAQVRKEYDESTAKLSEIQSRLSTLTKKLANDYGPEKEFFSFYDQCFENKENKYVYKVCPFKEASQVEGYSTTRLGRWENFADSYKVMQFSHGDKCWNGPDRSLKVKLRCGLKNELTDVDEPSRCEYVALLSTPAVCSEERLKELRHKLDSLNKQLPQSHDEL